MDLDGTLAHDIHPFMALKIGEPIIPMMDRVKKWVREGLDVRIFTARVGNSGLASEHGTDNAAWVRDQKAIISAWLMEHLGVVLPITATKDFMMRELWDDRAIQVIKNTGWRVDGQD